MLSLKAHSLAEFAKMTGKKTAWSFKNGGKQPALKISPVKIINLNTY